MIGNITACLVTRGDVQMDTIRASLPFRDILIWDNSAAEQDVSCYGRFKAAMTAATPLILTQDDDCLMPVFGLLEAFDPAKMRMLVNVPPDEKPLTAWGAIFYRDTVKAAFDRYLAAYPEDDFFYRTCDVIHTSLTPWDRVDLGHADFPWAAAENRMYRAPDHYDVREEAERRCKTLLA